MTMVVILMKKLAYQAKALCGNPVGLCITKQEQCPVHYVWTSWDGDDVTKEINAVCDFILEATEQAKALATLPKEERGPLYGLPLSVKVTLMSLGI